MLAQDAAPAAARSQADKDRRARLLNLVPQCAQCRGHHTVKPCPNDIAKRAGFEIGQHIDFWGDLSNLLGRVKRHPELGAPILGQAQGV